MQIFEKIITVTNEDLDELNHVNNVRYIEWANAIAKEHWEQNTTKDIRENFFWVVISHFIEYKSSALLGDIIKLKTYIRKTEGAKSTRVVEMYNAKTEKLIVKSETIWCFINSNNSNPSRITSEIASLFD
jgi:acyl-CoA thioester hydrolase